MSGDELTEGYKGQTVEDLTCHFYKVGLYLTGKCRKDNFK
jgi:hypothetical protein